MTNRKPVRIRHCVSATVKYTKGTAVRRQPLERRTALYALARENAKAEYDYAAEIEAIWAAILELQASIGGSSGGSSGEADDWPAYQQPTGAHDAYYTGDQITYNGKHYICKMDGCVWPPDAYPAGWEEQQ